MLKEVVLFIKYPYTAGIIATIWLGSAILLAINNDLPFVKVILIDMFCSVVMALVGFSGKNEV
jgi:hypothetical protein